MRPYTNDDGVRHYHQEEPPTTTPGRAWLWIVLFVGLIVTIDLVLAYWFRTGLHG